LLHVADVAVGDLVEVGGLAEMPVVPADLRLHEEARRDDGVPFQRSVVGAVADGALAAAGVDVGVQRRVVALRAGRTVGGVAEHGQLDLVHGVDHPGDLGGVVVRVTPAGQVGTRAGEGLRRGDPEAVGVRFVKGGHARGGGVPGRVVVISGAQALAGDHRI